MIEIKNLTKKYSKNGPVIIDDINLIINEGESIAILGANGSGKTTLVEMIAGIIPPTHGEIIAFNGDKNNKIGVQFQSGKWPFNTKPKDLLKFFVGRNWKEDSYVNELIEVFEVSTILNSKIADCSGGEQQRFNCLLSILNKPKVLILDEMITGLDLKMQIKLINYFSNLRKIEKLNLITVSHIPEEVEQMSERLLILKDGKIYKDLKIEEIKKEYKSVRNLLTLFFENKL